ncbi:MAG: hypothetical protein HYR51_09305 [Candidatus Rokubacteria bacterium]|nr:hypothetical protein [Candidatus Rokubacteria bacterium]
MRSSWEHDWMAYDSPDDARAAGDAYVARIASSTPASDAAHRSRVA